jgi:opacity protein-like surface antigen
MNKEIHLKKDLNLVLTSRPFHISPGFKIGAHTGIYSPADSFFKEMYGSGSLMFTGSVSLELIRNLEIRGEYNYFQDKGAMTDSQEELKFTIKDIVLEVRFRFFSGKKISPYLSAGFDFISYQEDYPERLGSYADKMEGNHLGAGFYFRLNNKFNLDFNVRYINADAKPFDEVIKLGGIKAGLGVEFRL